MRPRLIWRGCANLGPAAAVGLRIPIAFPAYVSHVARSRANVVPVSSCPARNSCPAATAGITTATAVVDADADADVAPSVGLSLLSPIVRYPLFFPPAFASSTLRLPALHVPLFLAVPSRSLLSPAGPFSALVIAHVYTNVHGATYIGAIKTCR